MESWLDTDNLVDRLRAINERFINGPSSSADCKTGAPVMGVGSADSPSGRMADTSLSARAVPAVHVATHRPDSGEEARVTKASPDASTPEPWWKSALGLLGLLVIVGLVLLAAYAVGL